MDTTTESSSLRQRGKKLNTTKLSALEKLKRIRQGEKIEDEEEEVEEDAYEYIEEEDDYDEDDYESSSKSSKSKNNKQEISNRNNKSTNLKRNLTRDKTSATIDETNTNNDIRTAFFKASTKKETNTNQDRSASTNEQDDDLANEIMAELNKKKKPKPAAQTCAKPAQIPFAINTFKSLSLSPAHKRKLSPMSKTAYQTNNEENLSQRSAKKRNETQLTDVSNQQETPIIKSEPICLDDDNDIDDATLINSLSSFVAPKKEPTISSSAINQEEEQREQFENMELLDQLMNLDMSKCSLNSIKQEPSVLDSPSAAANTSTIGQSTDLDLDLRNQHSLQEKFIFYWLDAYEDTYQSNGSIYLFGKTPIIKQQDVNIQYMSVCCIIKNIPKVVYVLPRVGVSIEKCTSELQTIMQKNKINQFKFKTCRRYYAFDKHIGPNKTEQIPFESDYLQVEYTTSSSTMNNNLFGDSGETYSCVFGQQQAYLEQFLIELKIKGPCWLQVNKSVQNQATLSWSKLEYSIDNYKNNISLFRDTHMPDRTDLILPSTPPLNILTLLTRTMLNTKTQEHEIICACGLVSTKLYLDKPTQATTSSAKQAAIYESYFCALTKPSSGTFPYDLQATLKNYQSKFKIELCTSERALLAFLLCKIQSLDIDILIGHDLFGFNLDIILNRCVHNKVPHWSRLGRLKRSVVPNSYQKNQQQQQQSGATNNLIIQQRIQTVCSGRLLCDVMLSAKELITKCKSYDLHDLAQHILFKGNDTPVLLDRNLDEEKQVAQYYNSSLLLMKYLGLAMTDATYIMRMCNDLQCLQLAYQITCIAGNVLSRTLVGGRSERNEFLLLHAFHDKDFILPDKTRNNYKKSKQLANKTAASQKPVKVEMKLELEDDDDEDDLLLSKINLTNITTNNNDETALANKKIKPSTIGYTGGLVLEPKVGFYDRFILLLDFNSLYPSIIQEYNICFTTINRVVNDLADTDMDEYLDTCIKLPGPDEKPGILPLEIRKLVDSRRQVKQLMQDKNLTPDLRMQYDIRQKALKLTANSVYGCLGFENSRFYCKPLAALITKNGRNILMKTKELVENKKIEVIYGDTDSIMINTNLNDYDGVIKLGNMVKSEVNKLYKHLEIDIDGVFKSLLLLRKKKYAALTVASRNPKDLNQFTYQKEIKGLDIVRRDWCLLAKQIGEQVLNEILSGQSCDTVLTNINKILNDTADRIKTNSFDLKLFEISKQLNRNPEDYGDSNHQSHVLVALRHNLDTTNNKKYKSGNVIAYVVCEDGTSNSSTQRAYSISELLKMSDTLKLDYKYYLTQQIHPVVTRLCEPIDGIDSFYVAQSLGLDPTGFKHKSSGSSGNNANVTLAVPQSKQQKKLESYMNEIEKYTNCIPFKYMCPECKTETNWQSPFIKLDNSTIKQEPMNIEEEEEDNHDDLAINGVVIKPVLNQSKTSSTSSNNSFKCILDACSNNQCKLKPLTKLAYIKNSLTNQLNKYIKQYYQTWLVCEDPMCSFRTKRLSCKFFNGRPQCIECERYATDLEYSHADLFYQMKFFKFIFDSENYKNYYKDDSIEVVNLLRNNKELANGLNQLRDFVNKTLKMNTYGQVNLKDLFKRF